MQEAIRERRAARAGALKGNISPAEFERIMKKTARSLDRRELLNELRQSRALLTVVTKMVEISIETDISALDALLTETAPDNDKEHTGENETL